MSTATESTCRSINLRGQLYYFDSPKVMGIINVTPDSFYAGSRRASAAEVAATCEKMLADGADMIDLGGYSTRPGAPEVDAGEEFSRLATGLEAIRSRFPDTVVSIDTFRASVARRCVEEFGADIINDISGGDLDADMFAAVAEMRVPYILMHTRGTPETMQSLTDYDDVTAEVLSDLAFKDARLRRLGVCDVIVDPGFGFAKTVGQNFELLDNMEAFRALERPLLIGLSRKSMIFRTLGCTPAEALNGTTVLNTVALLKGADILRVHDVRAAREAVTLVSRLKESSGHIQRNYD